MKFPTIPEEIKDWSLEILNMLINVIDIEVTLLILKALTITNCVIIYMQWLMLLVPL
jgi:hypothetical protein